MICFEDFDILLWECVCFNIISYEVCVYIFELWKLLCEVCFGMCFYYELEEYIGEGLIGM